MNTALLLVPADSNHASGFLATAMDLREKVYGTKKCMIFKMTVVSETSWSFLPAIKPPSGFSNDFDKSLEVANTFMTISHVGVIDGPIMRHGPMLQPWSIDNDTYEDTSFRKFVLKPHGDKFWRKVGQAACTVKIIISGCDSGQTYSQAVANAAGIDVYGFEHDIAAGVPSVMRPYIKGIESGKIPNGIARSRRSTNVGPIIHPMPDPPRYEPQTDF